jgi:hypothetical protein
VRTLKTEPNGELSRDARGHLILASGADAERVHAEIALRIRLGECPADTALGVDGSILNAADSPVPVTLEIERAVLKAKGIERVLACETEVVESAERAEALGVLPEWEQNPRRITHTEVLLKGAHGGEVKIGVGI